MSKVAEPHLLMRREVSAVTAGSTAAELARGMVDSGSGPPAEAVGKSALALAWALKDLCYAAWASDPQRAAKAADALRALCRDGSAAADPGRHDLEIDALTDWTGGIACITRGQMAEASACFDRAAAAFGTLGQAGHATQTQVPKIMALSMLGRYDEAIECAEHTQRSFVAQGDVRGAGRVSLNLGALHVHRGSHAQAARHSREAAVLFARVGDHQHSVTADTNMAHALASMGDFDEALRIFARARMRAVHHGFPVLQALVDGFVAQVQLARGRYHDALAGFEASRQQYEQLAMPQHLAGAEKELADVYLELRLLPEALALFDRVLARFEAMNRLDEQAWTLAQRGRVLALLDQPAQASLSFERAAALFAGQGSVLGESAVAVARGELALAGDDFNAAAALAEQAARGFATAGSAEGRFRADLLRAHALLRGGAALQARELFESALDGANDLQLTTMQVRCLTGKGLAAQALGDAVSAKAAFVAAIDLFERQRRALPGDDLRSAFLADHLRAYQELLRLALQAHAARPDLPAAAAEIVIQLDRFRARSLGERLEHDAAADDDASLQGLRDHLNWLYRRVRRLDEAGEPSAALTDELRRTELELLEGARRSRMVAASPERASDAADDFTVEALQALLPAGDALVEYGVLDDELFACVVTRAGVTLHRTLCSWSDALVALRAARFQIDALRHGAAPLHRHLESLAARTRQRMERLHALVWAPLAGSLGGVQRVLVVPHAQLGLLPFAALDDGERTLAQRHDLAVVPSARLALRGLLRQPRATRRAVVLGESSQLPHAAHEARFVAELFPQGRAFVGAQATLATLRAHAADADVIHLACHAQFRSDNPRFSALHLHDGPLTAELAESLDLQPGIVVLSACETGLAEHGSGDERVGLVRSFLVAGAARVLASLWPVDDAVTALFMSAFYGALCRGVAPAAALRDAQAEVMRQHPHPFYWAAFTVYGGW